MEPALPARPARQRAFPAGCPWGPKQVLIGGSIGAALFLLSSVALVIVIAVTGAGKRLHDVGDAFEKANTIAGYATERLRAATLDRPLPAPPEVLADQDAIKLGFATTVVYEVLLVAAVGGASGLDFTGLTRALGLRRFDFTSVWRPFVVMIGAYIMVAVYTAIVIGLDVGPLRPESTLPTEVTRDPLSLAMAAVLAVMAAPVAEELFFRGLIFGGLLRWGFWPAACVSGVLFALVHFDPGSVIPFFIVGVVMAWLFWARGTLWDSLMFHMFFNLTSIIILVAAA